MSLRVTLHVLRKIDAIAIAAGALSNHLARGATPTRGDPAICPKGTIDMRLLAIFSAACLVTGMLSACESGPSATEHVGASEEALRPWDDPPPDPVDCDMRSEGTYTVPPGQAVGTPGEIALLASPDLGGSSMPFDIWRAGIWNPLRARYEAAACPEPPSSIALCVWRPAGQIHCSFTLMPDANAPPPCDDSRPCPPGQQCTNRVCTEVCAEHPCDGHCGPLTACGVSYQCGECTKGVCDEDDHTCRPGCRNTPIDTCDEGHCNPKTERCEDDCQGNGDCPEGQACDTDRGRCEPACTPQDEPPGPSYECVDGVFRQHCSDPDVPCTDSTQECRDGFCRRVRCGPGDTCPGNRHCSGGSCIQNCVDVSCDRGFRCNVISNRCDPFDACVGVVCDGNTHCEEGVCVRNVPGFCGDGTCDLGETPNSCPIDCGMPNLCGDGVCGPGEIFSCPIDCNACGDGWCGPGEEFTCPADCDFGFGCGAVCGDGVCECGETPEECSFDCGGGGSEPGCNVWDWWTWYGSWDEFEMACSEQ